MNIFEPFVNGHVDLVNLEAISQTISESYHAFICQQHNRRERDRYNQVQIECIDFRKRINNRMPSWENSSSLVELYEFTAHHDFEASTSNQVIINGLNLELEKSSNLLNVTSTSYILPTSIDYKYCGVHKIFKESKGFC